MLDDSLVLKAAQFAAKAHEGQTRRGTAHPYIVHPNRVAEAFAARSDATVAGIAAAYLHDTIEDTTTTYEDLAREFGAEVAGVALALSHPPKEAGNRAKRQALYREQLKNASHATKVIKMLDRLDNLREMDSDSAAFKRLYIEETKELVEAIGHADLVLSETVLAETRVLAARFLA